jgi:hypothetical protein
MAAHPLRTIKFLRDDMVKGNLVAKQARLSYQTPADIRLVKIRHHSRKGIQR